MFHTTLANNTIAARVAFYHAMVCRHRRWTLYHVARPHIHHSSQISTPVHGHAPRSSRPGSHELQLHPTAIPYLAHNTTTTTVDTDADHNATPPDPPTLFSGTIYVDCQCTTGMIYTYPTSKFLKPSVSGNQYILIVYEYDGNCIYGAPMPDRTGPSIISAYRTAIRLFESRGFKPLLQRLDNEASRALQTFMDEEEVDFQLAPPQVHRRNAAESAIHTFKNHFMAGLCSTNRDFPLNLWDKLLPQCLITLNLL
jgi:hypothetical protein